MVTDAERAHQRDVKYFAKRPNVKQRIRAIAPGEFLPSDTRVARATHLLIMVQNGEYRAWPLRTVNPLDEEDAGPDPGNVGYDILWHGLRLRLV
jgi:hypothetical protein